MCAADADDHGRRLDSDRLWRQGADAARDVVEDAPRQAQRQAEPLIRRGKIERRDDEMCLRTQGEAGVIAECDAKLTVGARLQDVTLKIGLPASSGCAKPPRTTVTFPVTILA